MGFLYSHPTVPKFLWVSVDSVYILWIPGVCFQCVPNCGSVLGVCFWGPYSGVPFWGSVLGSRFGVPFCRLEFWGFQCVPNELFIKVQVWGPGVPFWGFRSGGPVLGVPFWGPYSGVRILGSVFWGPYSGVCMFLGVL